MSSRDKILGRIRTALCTVPTPADMPGMPAVWASGNLSREDLCGKFEVSLAAVGGESVVCSSQEDAAQAMEALLKEIDATRIGIAKRKIVTDALAHVDSFCDGAPDFQRFYAPELANEVSPQVIATLDASIIGAEYLLADTGSAVIASAAAFDRMLCYLPPVCCVVASVRMLREHLPDAWPEICCRIQGEATASPDTDPNVPIQHHGEFLIVTGPSRTADIEKILVMGVHGPKRLLVFIIAEE